MTMYVLLALSLAATAVAMPSYRYRLPNGFRVACPPGVADCVPGDTQAGEPASVCYGVGHRTCKGGTLPLNPFGRAFKQNGYKWTKALCEADSDGDGFTNGEELGDPCCTFVHGMRPSALTMGADATHPGFADAKPAVRAVCPQPDGGAGVAVTDTAPLTAAYRDGEEQRTIECPSRCCRAHLLYVDRTRCVFAQLRRPAWDPHSCVVLWQFHDRAH